MLLVASTAFAAPRIDITPATKGGVAFERGVLHVPENRKVATSRTIAIAFARLRSVHRDRPPIFFLYGGPGASYMDAFDETTANADRRFASLRRYAEVADVILLDQRGFSKRGTTLVNPTSVSRPLDRPTSLADTVAAWTAAAKAAPAANPGADLAGYTILECAGDIDDLRRALGYKQIVLLGGSFGSQLGFAVMRVTPAIVARAVLFGVEPLDNGLDMPSHVFAALQRVAADDPTLITAVRTLRDRFAQKPVTVRVGAKSIVLGLEDFRSALSRRAETFAPFIRALERGDYQAWAAEMLAEREGPVFGSLLNPLVDSGIGVTPARRHQLESDPAVDFLGTWNFAPHLETRRAWPTPDLTDALRTPVKTTIPTVFVNGDWDTSTPIENMLAIAPYFPNSRSIIVHRGEHDQVSYMLRGDPAAFAAILAFLGTGATAQLPVEVTAP